MAKGMPTRRTWLGQCGLLGLALAAGAGRAAEGELPVPADLAEPLAAALARREPLLLLASLPGCPYCRMVREQHLLPAWRAGQPVVQLDLRDARPVRDFAGRAVTQDALLRALGVRVAPTVLFLGAGGREIADRLDGAYLADFYGAYLAQRLAQARAALQA